MSRKDFTLIANALHASKPSALRPMETQLDLNIRSREFNIWRETCTNMTDALATTNKSFDRARFMTACGYSD